MSLIPNGTKRDRIRVLESTSVMLLYLFLGIAYLFPDELVRDPNATRNKSSVIIYIEQLTSVPVWGASFLFGALALFVGLVKWRKFMPTAHLICLSMMVGYSVSGFLTGYINPGTYIVSASLGASVAVTNVLLMFSYTSSGPNYIPVIDGVSNEDMDADEDVKGGAE